VKILELEPPSDYMDKSVVVKTPRDKKFLYNLVGDKRVVTVNRYRGSTDGFSSKDFHSKADGVGPTITLF
jgi:hypothetical protein